MTSQLDQANKEISELKKEIEKLRKQRIENISKWLRNIYIYHVWEEYDPSILSSSLFTTVSGVWNGW